MEIPLNFAENVRGSDGCAGRSSKQACVLISAGGEQGNHLWVLKVPFLVP